ncbi:hypothetical protein PRZ48_007516 [Zasmidium cellare]|uniref:Sucrose transporter n=1 Tax=Zasmidium cellare TaxID=395010 RepID=A0ABR0EJJ5_ZASCE|nr:hypothetical protein PRZ48_007516 [Zasmidium cellare]
MDNTVPWSESSSSRSSSNAPILEVDGKNVPLQRRIRTPSAESDSSLPEAGLRRSMEEEEGHIMENDEQRLPPRPSSDGKVSPLSVNSPERDTEHTWMNQYDNSMDNSPQKGKSVWYLFCLTACFFGLQVAWSVEQSEISPFLLDLGISRGVMAIIWIAGPLSGVLVQPYIGMKSDRLRSRFGKRRPFMVAGAIATIVSLMVLVWSFEITRGVLWAFGVEGDATRVTAIVVAVLMLYVLDFSINVLQASARTFVVDSAPGFQQDIANAWASRVSGIGDIIGFTFGYLELGQYLHALGDTQFKDLAFLTAIALFASTAFTVCAIPERDSRRHANEPHPYANDPRQVNEPHTDAEDPHQYAHRPDHGSAERASSRSTYSGDISHQTLLGSFKELWQVMTRLPPQIKKVCLIQLAAWVGWFPILFYTSTWIRDLYMDNYLREKPNVPVDDPTLSEHGTRLGSLGLLIKAVVTLTCSIALPWIVRKVHLLTLKRIWIASHVIFAVLAGLTFLVDRVRSAILLTACTGIPWAITLWAPFAIIAAEMKDGFEDDAGAILGIHNMAIALPQVIAILASSAIFQSLHTGAGEVDPDSIAWVFRFGGAMALVAAGLTWRLEDKE